MADYDDLARKHDELVRQMGDEISPFPGEGIDAFLSHFIMTIEVLKGDAEGQIVSFTMPPSIQTVARSKPFRYEGRDKGTEVKVPLPSNCSLSETISEDDFLERPDGFFQPGCEAVWMQILNLDARAEVEDLGHVRIILGETLKRDYPDVYQPSLGVAEALGDTGFPARLFFNPYALIETEHGAFRAIHGTLSYGRVTQFPPLRTPISINDMVPMEHVDDVRDSGNLRSVEPQIDPFARIIALAHPIDVPMQLSGDEAFNLIERRIARA